MIILYKKQCTIMEHSGAFLQPMFQKKSYSIIYCECVFVAFVIQHAMRICGLSNFTKFSTLSHKQHDLRK